jgi:cell division protein FtsZ
LHEAEAVLVSIAGGTDLTMGEVNRIMEQIGHQCAGAHVIMGTLIDDEFLQRVSVTLVAARFDERSASEARPSLVERAVEAPARGRNPVTTPADPPVASTDRTRVSEAPLSEVDTAFFRAPAVTRPPSRFVPPPPENLPLSKQHELLKSQRRGAGKGARAGGRMRQELLPLEIVSKGRFEKSEPTIHRGEDLDVPTYIRRGVALN